MSTLEFIGQIAVPVLALVVSGISFYLTNRMYKRVNRKDFEISENVKYELLQLVAALRSLDAKAVISPHVEGKMDYSQEIGVISQLRMSPGYLVFLHSIHNDDDRFWIDFNIQMLSAIGNDLSMNELRMFSNRILDVVKNKTNLKGMLDLEMMELMKEFCEMKGTAPEHKGIKEDTAERLFKAFVSHLVKEGIDDPDVLVWYAVLYDNTVLLKQALDSGGKSNLTQRDLIDKYKDDFQSFKDGFL